MPADKADLLDAIALELRLEQFLTSDMPAIQYWYVDAHANHFDKTDETGAYRQELVARMTIVKGNLTDPTLLDQFDMLSTDLVTVGTQLLDPDYGDLKPEVADKIDGGGASLVVLDTVEITESWRGYGLAPLLAGEALLALDGDASLIATYPAPISGGAEQDSADRQRAIEKLERVWAVLGFEHHAHGIWILDPTHVTLSNAVRRLKNEFGIR